MIRLGHKGEAVVNIQARLKRACYPDLEVTGAFDERTLMAAKLFQGQNGLVIDGIVGRNTAGALEALTADSLLYLFIHCTASPPSARHVTGEWVKRYHTERRGWSRPGYSDVIELDGTITNIFEYDHDNKIERKEYTWGTRLLNRNARHVCYVGGVDGHHEAADTRTDSQKQTLAAYVKTQIAYNPDIDNCRTQPSTKKGVPFFRRCGVGDK